MLTPDIKTQIESEGRDISIRGPQILGIARPLLTSTALVREQAWTPKDPHALKIFFVEAAPFTHPKLSPTFWDTTLLCSLYEKAIAQKLELDPAEAEVVGLIHDIGRLITPHRYYRNDLIAKNFAKHAGIRPEVMDQIAPLDRIIGLSRGVDDFEDLSLKQIVNHVADNLGRSNSEGELVTLTEIMKFNSAKRYRQTLWPSETRAVNALNEPKGKWSTKETWCNALVITEALWLHSVHGIDLDEVRLQVQEELDSNENQTWLYEVKVSQKLTLLPTL